MNTDPVLIIHVIIGPLLLFVSVLGKIFPAKKINTLYGYRTTRAMKSPEAWNTANRYSAKLMFRLGIVTILFQATVLLAIGGTTSILATLAFFIAGVIWVMVQSERHLKKQGF